MTNIAIRVENLSKLYTIGRAQPRHDALRDSIADFRRLQIPCAPAIFDLQSPIFNPRKTSGPCATSPSR